MRAADLLQVDEKKLQSINAAEDIQVVHYDVGQKYEAHHDWGVICLFSSRKLTNLSIYFKK